MNSIQDRKDDRLAVAGSANSTYYNIDSCSKGFLFGIDFTLKNLTVP